MALVTGACRQNNGDIDFLYGSWALTGYTVDGETPADFEPDLTFFSFQNSIVRVSIVDDHHSFMARWGTWTRDDKVMTFDFGHSDDFTPAGTGAYAPPSWIGISEPDVRMEIVSRDGKDMTMMYNAPDAVRVYTLKKTW